MSYDLHLSLICPSGDFRLLQFTGVIFSSFHFHHLSWKFPRMQFHRKKFSKIQFHIGSFQPFSRTPKFVIITSCLYRLCQKKLYNLVLNIQNIFRISYQSHFTVWIVLFFSCNLFFVSFKLDIHKLRYCHLSEPINFLLGPVQWITVLDTLTWTALMESNNRQAR